MKYTENYKLKKPEPTDSYNVEDFNENAEAIDKKFKENEKLLTVEDISDSFIESGDDYATVKLPMIYKQGKVVCGSFILEINGGGEHDIYRLKINNAYATIHSVGLSVNATNGYDKIFGAAEGDLKYNNLTVYVQKYDAIVLSVSFSYICQ